MGLSLVAELNHYPGPKHVLELAQPLELTSPQLREIKDIETAMKVDAERLGAQLLDHEARLDVLFASRRVDSGLTDKLIREIGRLQGELRLTHVNAHLATARILSSEQIAAYDKLRGYGDAHPREQRRSHH